jgi:hypothetical protein
MPYAARGPRAVFFARVPGVECIGLPAPALEGSAHIEEGVIRAGAQMLSPKS